MGDGKIGWDTAVILIAMTLGAALCAVCLIVGFG